MEGADCDECTDSAADQFCKLCLQYYCKGCWMKLHERVNTILMQKHSAGTVDLRKVSCTKCRRLGKVHTPKGGMTLNFT